MMPVTKEPHRSSDTSGTTVSPIDVVIDAVRYAHRHPTLTGILRSVILVTPGSGRSTIGLRCTRAAFNRDAQLLYAFKCSQFGDADFHPRCFEFSSDELRDVFRKRFQKLDFIVAQAFFDALHDLGVVDGIGYGVGD